MQFFLTLCLLVLPCVLSFSVFPIHGTYRARSSLAMASAHGRPRLQKDISFFNSLTRTKEKFVPIQEDKVSFYSCGPTVYDYAHIGIFRAFLMYDTVKRWLQYCGYCVDHVCNLTDVDDKIIAKMLLERKTLKQIAEKYTDAFFTDLAVLNIMPARAYPKATDHITTMDRMVKELVEKEHAYVSGDSVYFRVKSFPTYCQLSNVKLDEVRIGSGESGPNQRVGVANKESSADFVLWKGGGAQVDGGVPAWQGTYSHGRPGWHIECSAMCRELLGESIDIHAGGVDLLFPHHENEIAQSEAATGKKLSRFWMHNGFVNIDNQKMSKSLQNFKTLRDILKHPDDARTFRYMIVSAQYRNSLSFTEETWTAARRSLRRIDRLVLALQKVVDPAGCDPSRSAEEAPSPPADGAAEEEGEGGPHPPLYDSDFVALCERCLADFEAAMCDDLNAPRATAALFVLVGATERALRGGTCTVPHAAAALQAIAKMNEVLGVLYDVPKEYFPEVQLESAENLIPEEVVALAELRKELKMQRNFAEADAARNKIVELGYKIVDSPGGFVVTKL